MTCCSKTFQITPVQIIQPVETFRHRNSIGSRNPAESRLSRISQVTPQVSSFPPFVWVAHHECCFPSAGGQIAEMVARRGRPAGCTHIREQGCASNKGGELPKQRVEYQLDRSSSCGTAAGQHAIC
ncbi:hypothetical protein pipiens_015215 [Culex pipiens pipiens]|uniref:Uncharacterized protein n=2 Tax=Culex pipiens TaxID=7175 RepID=A0ABD1CRF0_CULPP